MSMIFVPPAALPPRRYFAIEGTFPALTELDGGGGAFDSDYLNAPTWDVGLYPFLMPEGVTIESSVDKISPGITVHAEITLPLAGYRYHSEDERVAKAPQWLIDRIVGKPPSPPPIAPLVPPPPPPPMIAAAPPLAPEPVPAESADTAATSDVPARLMADMAPKPYRRRDPKTLPNIPWLYSTHLLRGCVSLTIGATGTSKTYEKIAETLAMVTGRKLLHDTPPDKLRCWLYNGEEDMVMLQRRIEAACIWYNISDEEIGDRLFVNDRRTKMVIARKTRDGVTVMDPVKDALIRYIRENQLDVLSIDPFITTHAVGENDNGEIDQVVKTYADIAQETGCAIDLVHHTRKSNGGPVTIEDSRGASASASAARAGRTLNLMSEQEARSTGVESRFRYFRIDDAKPNHALRRQSAQWFKMESVFLGNDPTGLAGDSMGVVTPWALPDAAASVADTDLEPVWAAIRAGEWRKDSQAGAWVGKPIATALGLDLTRKADDAKVKALIKKWLKDKKLTTVQKKDEKYKGRSCVEVANG